MISTAGQRDFPAKLSSWQTVHKGFRIVSGVGSVLDGDLLFLMQSWFNRRILSDSDEADVSR